MGIMGSMAALDCPKDWQKKPAQIFDTSLRLFFFASRLSIALSVLVWTPSRNVGVPRADGSLINHGRRPILPGDNDSKLVVFPFRSGPENQETVDICRTGAGSTIDINGLKYVRWTRLINSLALQFEGTFYISSRRISPCSRQITRSADKCIPAKAAVT